MSDEAIFNLLCWALAIVSFLGGFVFGMDYANWKRLRHNQKVAEAMRTNIRYYDARIAEFAPSVIRHAQSKSQHERLPEMLTTPLASPAPSAPRRICPRGPEACLCDDCMSRGIPPPP